MRLDEALVKAGLAESRSKARALVMAGRVTVDGEPAWKPGRAVSPGARLEVKPGPRFVSRGGEKLEGALLRMRLDVSGLVLVDVGASTGGFTDCLLAHGAARVYAVDVGYGLLDARLRDDPRVVVLERVNARYLSREHVPEPVDGATVDVAFISATKILPALAPLVKQGGFALVLVKPQFEAGRGVARKGVVRDPSVHAACIAKVAQAGRELGMGARDLCPSPVLGPAGNVEFFLLLERGAAEVEDLPERIERVVLEGTRLQGADRGQG